MNKKILMALVTVSAATAFWCCSDNTSPVTSLQQTASEFVISSDAWLYDDGANQYLIYPDGTVTASDGTAVAVFDATTGAVTPSAGVTVTLPATIDVSTLPVASPDGTVTKPDGTKTTINELYGTPAETEPTQGQGTVSTGKSSASTSTAGNNTNSNTGDNSGNQANDANSSASNGSNDQSAANEVVPLEVSIGNLTVKGGLKQTVKANDAINTLTVSGFQEQPSRQSWNLYFLEGKNEGGTFTISGTVPDHFQYQPGSYSETWIVDGNEVTLTVIVPDANGSTSNSNSGSNDNNNNNSDNNSGNNNSGNNDSGNNNSGSTGGSTTIGDGDLIVHPGGTCPDIKYVSGGMSGSGHASRYWDCCRPGCSWPNNAKKGTGVAPKQCSISNMSIISDANAVSACDGGSSTTCVSQQAFTIDGCENIGFAYAATPGNESCGKCFELTFTGEGKYETKLNHKKLKGKKLIVMATNTGSDVAGGQFDIMIPGGGLGLFNGCSNMPGWKDMGSTERYGGLLSDCEKQVGYSGSDESIYTKRKECLISKCNEYFSGDAQSKSGCLFLADFMEAAGNPKHTYKQVECPSALVEGY